jgi:hypothetical protein
LGLSIWPLKSFEGGVSKALKVASIDIVGMCKTQEKGPIELEMKIAVDTAKTPRARATALVRLRPDITSSFNLSEGSAVGALEFFGKL